MPHLGGLTECEELESTVCVLRADQQVRRDAAGRRSEVVQASQVELLADC